MKKSVQQRLVKLQIEVIKQADPNKPILAQVAGSPSSIPFKAQPERCASNVLRANFNTVGSQQFTSKWLEANLNNLRKVLGSPQKDKSDQAPSNLKKVSGWLKGIITLSVINPTSQTGASSGSVAAVATNTPIFDTKDIAGNFHGDLIKIPQAIKKDLVNVTSPDNACVHPDDHIEMILDAINENPQAVFSELAKDATNTVISGHSLVIGKLADQAIKIAAVLINTTYTNNAVNKIINQAARAYGFQKNDPDIETIRKIIDDTRYLRAIFVSKWQFIPKRREDNSPEVRSLYREAAMYELMCVLGRDAMLRKTLPEHTGHLSKSLCKRLREVVAVGLYGADAHRIPNQEKLLERVQLHCNNTWLHDIHKAHEIQVKLNANKDKISFAPDNIKRDRMYEQLLDVRSLCKKEHRWAQQQILTANKTDRNEAQADFDPAP